MVDRESKRTCFKCGCSPAVDGIKLFRFPKPAVRNLVRCELWARYIFPDRNPTLELQRKLHSEHRMLCQNHFRDEDFTDNTKQFLIRDAAPSDDENIHVLMELEAGPSHRVPFVNIGNVDYLNPTTGDNENTQAPTEPEPGSPPRIPFADISNITCHKISSTTEDENIQVLMELEAGPSHRVPFVNVANVNYHNPTTGDDDNIQATSKTAAGHSRELTIGPSKVEISKENEKRDQLYAKCSKYMKKTYQLRNRIKKLKRKEVLKVLSEENCIKKLSSKLTPAFALLLQGQIKNYNKKLTGRRWSKEEKLTALRIFKRSPTCYRLLRRMFHLPAPTTLKTMLNKVPFNVGPNQQIFKILSDYVNLQKPSDNNYILMFDEMSLKKHLYYNVKYDLIEGYQDHAEQGRSPLVASYALVFMIAGIRKRVKQPIAHYFSSGFSTADRLVVLVKEVLFQCFQAGINITAIVCDMDGVNRRALTILGATIQHPCITVHEKDIITLFDTPHLLKCFRNLFLKYDIECKTNISTVENITGKGVARWSHIKDFYEIDSKNPNFVYAPALRKDHLNPNTKQKMKVKLAAQIFSHSVAGGMYSKIHRGELPAEAVITANVLSNMDKLFDSLNSDQTDLRRGKPHATNLTEKTPHLEIFGQMKTFFENIKFIGSPRKPPSQEGWIWTINAVELLWRKLKSNYKVNSLPTRRLQQDPIENLFGCIRGNCGANTNPTAGQFVAGLKTSILSNLANIGTSGNCETDNNIIINNLDKLLSVSQSIQPSSSISEQELDSDFEYMDMGDIADIEEESAEILACTYVCGFITKNMKIKCSFCKDIFISKEAKIHHSFVEWREYVDDKKSLNYVTKNLVSCVECCATFINDFLKEKGFINNIKKNIKTNLLVNINFEFLNQCNEHKKKNIEFIINSVFNICIKRFCILQNRKFSEEASASALKRKMNIIMHK